LGENDLKRLDDYLMIVREDVCRSLGDLIGREESFDCQEAAGETAAVGRDLHPGLALSAEPVSRLFPSRR
jgi:hypothetical protein